MVECNNFYPTWMDCCMAFYFNLKTSGIKGKTICLGLRQGEVESDLKQGPEKTGGESLIDLK